MLPTWSFCDPCKGFEERVQYMVRKLVDVKTRIPKGVVRFINQLVERGYYSSLADFARQSILDKLINDFELGISELEPDLVELKSEEKQNEQE